MANTQLSQVQANWMLLGLLGATDLFMARHYRTKTLMPGEDAWLAAQVQYFTQQAAAIGSSCSADFQTIQSQFANLTSMSGSTNLFRGPWMTLLNDNASFDGSSLGSWIMKNLSQISWTDSVGVDNQSQLCWFTTFLFADLEDLFIGSISYLESYWHPLAQNSADALAAFCSQLQGNYSTNLSFMCDVIDSSNFTQGPYAQYSSQFYLLNSLLKKETAPTSPSSIYSAYTSSFTNFAQLKAQPNSFPGFYDFGNYLAKGSLICSTLNQAYQIFNATPFTPILMPTLSSLLNGDEAKELSVYFKASSQDATVPYYGFWQSAAYQLDTAHNWAKVADPTQWGTKIFIQLNGQTNDFNLAAADITVDQLPQNAPPPIRNVTFGAAMCWATNDGGCGFDPQYDVAQITDTGSAYFVPINYITEQCGSQMSSPTSCPTYQVPMHVGTGPALIMLSGAVSLNPNYGISSYCGILNITIENTADFPATYADMPGVSASLYGAGTTGINYFWSYYLGKGAPSSSQQKAA